MWPTGSDLLSLLLVLALTMSIAAVVGMSRLPRTIKALVVIALALRVAGAFARYRILFGFYTGTGDAAGYFGKGLRLADQITRLDFAGIAAVFSPASGHWWGTNFISLSSGLVLAAIGPSMIGTFIVFGLLSFLGLVGFAIAFKRAFPGNDLSRYLKWIWLFPSLWFWPSSLGKDALVLLGIGLAVWGFGYQRDRVHWILLSLGVALVFVIRPQVAAVLLVCLLFGYWIANWKQLASTRIIQGTVFVLGGAIAIWISLQQIGVEGFDIEGAQSYLAGTVRSEGGSRIAMTGAGLGSAPMAMINVLFRPFLWESRNIVQALSSLELCVLWALVLFRAPSLLRGVMGWRKNKLIGATVPFLIIYSTTLGMGVANLGIIARQRIFLFPFLFLLVESGSKRVRELSTQVEQSASRNALRERRVALV